MLERFRYIRMSVVVCALLAATLLAAYALFAAGNAQAGERESGRVTLQKPPADTGSQEPSREPQIVGGTTVPDGKYPFMALLKIYRDNGKVSYCGGSLIDTNSVLTAGHCVNAPDLYGIKVYVGRTVATSTRQGYERHVTTYEVDSRYREYAYDSAVLTLNKPVKSTDVRPVRLATAQHDSLETPGRMLTVAGWGTTSEGGSLSSRMREVSVPVVSDTRARQSYPFYFPAVMVAAGKAGKDSCQGDSGGPLFKRTSGGFVQVGIVSFGYGCARAGYPGVYTEVNNPGVRNFIVRSSAAPF